MSKAAETEFKINTTYLRSSPVFSLAPKGQEVNIEFEKCNFYTKRESSPDYIVQTYSVGNLESAVKKMVISKGEDITVKRGPGVSVHYIIDIDGTIYNLVPDSGRAWDSGAGAFSAKSKLNPGGEILKDMNSHDISIMSINDGKSPLTAAQISANLALTNYLISMHHIPKENVVALGDWAVGRHIAPGPYFPWEEFAKNGIGLWPSHVTKNDDSYKAVVSYKNKGAEVTHVQKLLKVLGLDVAKQDPDAEGVYGPATLSQMLSFHLHFDGEHIVKTEELNAAYGKLWSNSSDNAAVEVLGGTVTQYDIAALESMTT